MECLFDIAKIFAPFLQIHSSRWHASAFSPESMARQASEVRLRGWKYTERVYKMSVVCRQYDDDLTYVYGVINDEEGQPREFSSYMAGLNWLGRMGWEMLPYPTTYRSDMSQDLAYWFRMDVSGLSTDDINAKLSALKPSKE